LKIFIAGIIQGSLVGLELHDQDYRAQIKQLLALHAPDAEIICPMDNHPDGIAYGPAEARAAFISLAEQAGQADLLICYLPEASMGTAIEMWQAYRNGRPVVAITPMAHNWAIRFLSTRIFPSLAEFEAFVASGGLEDLTRCPNN
jgi:hypothetical protein